MKRNPLLPSPLAARLCAALLMLVSAAASARAGEKVLFPMSSQTPGPNSALTADGAGNFYGIAGGPAGVLGGCNQVYELSPTSGGQWQVTVIYKFQNCAQNGMYPLGSLSIDKEGNLYGSEYNSLSDGSGQVYELKKRPGGNWLFGVLHNFPPSEGGPVGDLTFDSAGNIYGATYYASTAFDGEVFELSPQSNGTWKESILYTFNYTAPPAGPADGLTFDSQGNLYGPAFYGSHGGYGAIYKLSPQSNGSWALTTLYNFKSGPDGSEPNSKLVFDSEGNLYGTALEPANGQVFQLRPAGGGLWTKTTIHAFLQSNQSDGRQPLGTLVFDSKGNLYGETEFGGTGCNQNLCGVIYELSPQAGGSWTETILHQFESAEDGSEPQGGITLDGAGNIYGTTYHGGSRYGYGTIFEITP
ncbi:MAG TPA: choice-of-anchor tandem repeat GloVer-containing protein [Candidatus Binatia bacterium]|nr:choice-of-anchor tandem repeat GloVer-containing protein [Candidatus Binatia bacterium]